MLSGFKGGGFFGGTGASAGTTVLLLLLAPLLLALLAAPLLLSPLLAPLLAPLLLAPLLPRGVARGLVRQGDGVLAESLPSNCLSIDSTIIISSWRWRLLRGDPWDFAAG